MPYSLTTQSSVSVQNVDNSISTLFKSNNSALEIDSTFVYSVKVLPSSPLVVLVPNITKIQVISAKADSVFDISLKQVNQVDNYTECPCTTFLLVNPLGFTFEQLKIRTTVETLVSLTIGGKF